MTNQELIAKIQSLQAEAKELWGTGPAPFSDDTASEELWKYHLNELLVSEDPAKYLKDNL